MDRKLTSIHCAPIISDWICTELLELFNRYYSPACLPFWLCNSREWVHLCAAIFEHPVNQSPLPDCYFASAETFVVNIDILLGLNFTLALPWQTLEKNLSHLSSGTTIAACLGVGWQHTVCSDEQALEEHLVIHKCGSAKDEARVGGWLRLSAVQ